MKKRVVAGSSSGGFTLLEMLVVVVMIGILSAIAAPSWLAFLNSQRLNTAQNLVYRAMREAQSNAKRDKITWQASFREHNDVVQWAVHPANVSPNLAEWHSFDSAVKLDSETTYPLLNSGVRRVEFGIMGEVKTIPFGRITLSSKDGGKAKRCVFVSTLLGALRTANEQAKPDNGGKYCH